MYIAVDIETTGFNQSKNDIIQLAAVLMDNDFNIIKEFNEFMKPVYPQYWSVKAEKIHRISIEKAMQFQDRRLALIKLMHLVKEYIDLFPLAFIYHGKGGFDYRFLKDKFISEGLVSKFEMMFNSDQVESTVEMASKYLFSEDYKLSTLCKKFNIELNHHDALSDARACALIYRELSLNGCFYRGDLLI